MNTSFFHHFRHYLLRVAYCVIVCMLLPKVGYGGNLAAQEYGDPVYRYLDVLSFGVEEDHAALFAGLNSSDSKRAIEVEGMFASSTCNGTIGVNDDPFSDFLCGSTYFGANMSSSSTRPTSFSGRYNIMATAHTLDTLDPGYPLLGLDCLDPKSGTTGRVDPSHIDQLRCDGLVEYCYEYNGFPVWGKNGTHYDISYYWDEHNTLYNWQQLWPDPNTGLAPIVQRGGAGGTSTYMNLAAVVDNPTINVYTTQNPGNTAVTIEASDQSGIHKIQYKWGSGGSVISQTFQQYPDSGYKDVTTSTTTTTDLYVWAQDGAGNDDGLWHIYTITVTSVSVPPTISWFNVNPSTVVLGEGFTISYTVSDASGSGLKQIALWRASINGSATDSSWQQVGSAVALSGNGPTNGSFTDAPPAVGSYWYGLHVLNNANKLMDERTAGWGPIQVMVTTPDTTGPAVAITFPANNATVTSPSLSVTGTASDSGFGNNGVSSVTVNGASASGGTASGANTAYWSATITLTPGVNTIIAVAKDTLNNSGQQQISVTYNPADTTPPTVSISSPTSGQTFTSSPITVIGSASDPGSPSSGVTLVEVRVNGGSWQPASLSLPNWNGSVSLSSGSNLVEALSQDSSGNYSTIASVTVTLLSGLPQYTNLDFESASFLPAGSGWEYQASSALPGWTTYIGTNLQGSVQWDDDYMDQPGIAIWDKSTYDNVQTPFEGRYTVVLETATSYGFAFPSVAIAQTGQIPSDAKSLGFFAHGTDFDVRVGGQTLPYAILSSTSSYSVCGVDVSSFAGIVAELRFTANQTPPLGFAVNNIYLDAIQFSSTALPPLGTVTTSSSPTGAGTTVGSGNYANGQVATVVASASSGYTFVKWTESGNVVWPSPSYAFTVNSNRDLVANFTPAIYTVTPSAGANGSIIPNTPLAVTYGGSVAFTATPADGYVVDQWLVNGLTVADGVNYTLTNVAADTSVQVTFQLTPSESYSFITLAGVTGHGGTNNGTGNAARFYYPNGVAIDTNGNVYVVEPYNDTIRKVTAAGVVTTLAGLAGSFGSSNGTGSDGRFYYPYGVAVDTNGNIYVADTFNHTIRKVTTAGVVTTLAGLAGSSGTNDGTGSDARFYEPGGVAVDTNGNVYVADTVNNAIRKVTAAGVVTTLAGFAGSSGTNNGTVSDARFYHPYGVAVDTNGNVYVADTGNNTIRMVTAAGVVTTLAGLAGSSGGANGTGSAARFYNPNGVAVDADGNVYVADTYNDTIRKVTEAGVVTTLAGLALNSGTNNGTGSAARFYYPSGVAVDSAGNVYVADSNNQTIRKGNVLKTALTVTANNASRTYGSVNRTFSATVSGFVNGDTLAVVSGAANLDTTATATSLVGLYPIVPTLGTLNAANYTFAIFVNGTLTVTPAPLTIRANSRSKTDGEAVAFAGTEFTASGLVNGDTAGSVTLTSSGAVAAAGVGSYNITPSGATGGTFNPANYAITYQDGVLTVNPALGPLTNGLIAYYPFDGNAEDASGNGNDGTLVDCVPVVDRHVVASGALGFNGVDSHVDILSLNTNPIITLCAWVRPEAGSSEDFMVVVAGDNGGWDRGFDLGKDGSTQVHEGNQATNISTAIPFDTWIHVALVYSSTDILLYVNGALIWQNGGPAVGWEEGAWCIGRNNASGGHWPFKGAIDDVRIYGRALSASEVVQLCDPLEGGLIAYYPFDGDASDHSGNGNDGTVVGCVPVADRHSMPSGALWFNGVDSHVDILNLNTNPIITLCAWVRPEAGSSEDFMVVVAGDNGGWDRGFDLGKDGSTQVHEGNQATNITTAIPFGTWSHVALVYSSTDILLYVNGALIWQRGGPAVEWDEGNWCIGRNNASGGHWPFKGAIDDVRIYGRVLSAAEVGALAGLPYLNLPISIQRVGTDFIVTWSSGTLLSADSLGGPWSPVAGATSPWTNAPSAAKMFYRLKR